MENGLTVAKFLTYITLFLEKQLGERLGVDIDKLQTLKVNSTAQAKLYNWNILAQEIEMFDIALSNDEKREIVQGDHHAIINLINRMKEILHGDVNTTALLNKSKTTNKENKLSENEGKPKAITAGNGSSVESKKNKLPKAAVDIEKLEMDKSPNECSNCVEFILLTLSQALKLTPKQAAAFLAKDNQFLTEA